MDGSGSTALRASVIVRCKDKASTIERTFLALREQTVPVEVVVVDSGSTDGTLEIAERYADRLLRIRPEEFSYGHALNLGAAAASGEVHFALSAHGTGLSPTWIADSLRHYADPVVAGTNGIDRRPDGSPLREVYLPTLAEARADCTWGYSNHAGSWRAETWRRHPFRADMRACEDKEWFWRVLGAGWRVAFDPALMVPSLHRRRDGLRALWRRTYLEGEALAAMGARPAGTFREAAAAWWSDFPPGSSWPPAVRRVSPYRAAEQWGSWFGARAGRKAPLPPLDQATVGSPNAWSNPDSSSRQSAARPASDQGPPMIASSRPRIRS